MILTDDDVIKRGVQAKAILADEGLRFFFDDELERIRYASFNTPPDGGKLRSELYYRHHALTEFIISLTAYSNAADELIAAQESARLPQEIDD